MKAPFDSRQLRAFVTLARTGSFTAAAKELFLSQSAVSHSIKALEEEAGCRLLDRVGKKIALTPAGEQLRYHADKIVQDMEAARTALEQLEKWGHARLRIAAPPTACEYLLPEVLKEMQQKYPKCAISIEPCNNPTALDLLRENRVDLVLGLQTRQSGDIEFQPLFVDELMFITGPRHSWAVAGKVVREKISEQKLIVSSKSSFTFRLLEEYFHKEKATLHVVIETGSIETVKQLVRVESGITIQAPWVAEEELSNKSLVALPLGKRKLRRAWGVLHRSDRGLNLIEQTFIDLCRKGKFVRAREKAETGIETACPDQPITITASV